MASSDTSHTTPTNRAVLENVTAVHALDRTRSFNLVYNIPLLIPVLNHINQVQTANLISLSFILILSSHVCLGFLNGVFRSCFATKPRTYCSPLQFSCLAQFIILDLINLITFGEEYKLRSSTLLSLHPSYVLHFPQYPIHIRPQLCLYLNVKDQVLLIVLVYLFRCSRSSQSSPPAIFLFKCHMTTLEP